MFGEKLEQVRTIQEIKRNYVLVFNTFQMHKHKQTCTKEIIFLCCQGRGQLQTEPILHLFIQTCLCQEQILYVAMISYILFVKSFSEVADRGFSRGSATHEGERQPPLTDFSENCMKMKNFWPVGCPLRPLDPPLLVV